MMLWVAFFGLLVVTAVVIECRPVFRVLAVLALTGLYYLAACQVIGLTKYCERSKFESEVVKPTGHIIQDLHSEAQAGNHAVLASKLEILRKDWARFESDGPAPEAFQNHVVRPEVTITNQVTDKE